jgi:hypothetical protein
VPVSGHPGRDPPAGPLHDPPADPSAEVSAEARAGRAGPGGPADRFCRRWIRNMTIRYEWRGSFDNSALNQLHAEGFGHRPAGTDWRTRLLCHSLGWVCAREERRSAGFVDVAWEGGVHAFLLDTVVARRDRSGGVKVVLVEAAADGARTAGCVWLHVDCEPHLRPFHFDACGFRETAAGLIAL